MVPNSIIALFISLVCFCNTALAASALSGYDPTISVFLFQKKMATKGSASAQFKLGTMYETGAGIPNNISSAKIWYKKAAEQAYKPAQNRLIFLDIKKNGFIKRHQKWLKTLRHDARFGDGEALFLLAQLYNTGIGVKKNQTLALKLLKKASAANIAGAEIERLKIEDQLLQKKYKPQTLPPKPAPVLKKKSPKISPTQRNLQFQEQQRQLKQTAIDRQQRVFAQRYQQLKKKQAKLAPATPSATQTYNKNKNSTNSNDDICSGSNRFIESCR